MAVPGFYGPRRAGASSGAAPVVDTSPMSGSTQACDDVVIHGAGDHGRVVAEAARLAGYTVRGWRDDARAVGERIAGLHVLADEAVVGCRLHVAVGDNAARARISRAWSDADGALATIVHPRAWVSPSAVIEPGVFLGPHAVVHVEARIGQAAIINSGAIVEHHAVVGPAAHIAPGAVLAGRVEVGAGTLIGANAVVQPRLRIGRDAIVGGGAVVTHHVPDRITVVGNPARDQ